MRDPLLARRVRTFFQNSLFDEAITLVETASKMNAVIDAAGAGGAQCGQVADGGSPAPAAPAQRVRRVV